MRRHLLRLSLLTTLLPALLSPALASAQAPGAPVMTAEKTSRVERGTPSRAAGLERFKAGRAAVYHHPDLTAEVVKELPEVEIDDGGAAVMRTRLREGGAEVVVWYERGSSDVETISLRRPSGEGAKAASAGKALGAFVMASRVYIPGDGAVYVETPGDIHGAPRRRKFVLEGDRLAEVEQPFAHVGREVTLARPTELACGPYEGGDELVLLAAQRAGAPQVATLRVGDRVEVVLRDGRWFLLRTSFGLVGWVEYEGPYSLYGMMDPCWG